jgi:uncharacterized protein YndB with AHSA1/START domain
MAGDDIVFQFDIAAEPEAVRSAVASAEGIAGWWTDRAEVSEGRAVLEFPGAEAPYDFTVREDGVTRVVWATRDRPRVWHGTTISYDLSAAPDGGTRLFFRHGGFRDDESRAIPAFVWGQLMPLLKRYLETGERRPFFTAAMG